MTTYVRSQDFYSMVAALLVVLLGLGLIHLYFVGELAATAVFAILAAVAMIVPSAVLLFRGMREQPRRRRAK